MKCDRMRVCMESIRNDRITKTMNWMYIKHEVVGSEVAQLRKSEKNASE